MHDEVRHCLKAILPAALQHAATLPPDEVPFLVWTRKGSGWYGSHELHPVLPIAGPLSLEELARPLEQVMSRHHPEHLGLVGTAHAGLRLDAEYLLRNLVYEVWDRHATLDVSGDVIDSLSSDFESFIDATQIRIRYLAPIVNLRVEPVVAEIPLSSFVTIKQLTDADVSELYGGRADALGHLHRPEQSGFPEYAFVGVFDEPKRFGFDGVWPSQQFEQVQAQLRRAVLALRSYGSGPIGYREVHLRAVGFCPGLVTTITGTGEYIPLGRYVLSAGGIDSFRAHAQHVAARLHPALDLAISRLSDAEVRTSPRDKLVDAVIGLEAVLLHGGQRQELRYRFAMNYASLVDVPAERLAKLAVAMGIYNCRSKLVHGGHIADSKLVIVGEQKLTLSQAAETACEMLREVVKHFLPEGDRPAFCGQQYWEQRLFGLTHPSQ